jgi:hypothetical protein
MTDPLRSPERIAACDLRYLRGLVRKAETGFVSVNVNVLRGALDLLTAKAERLAQLERKITLLRAEAASGAVGHGDLPRRNEGDDWRGSGS